MSRRARSSRKADARVRPSLHGAFREIVDVVPDAAVVADPAGVIRLVNRAAESLFGYAPGALVGRPLEMLIPERFRASHRSQFDAYLQAPRSRPLAAGLDLWALRKDGVELPVDISVAPLEAAEGRHVTAWIRDATERSLFLRSLHERRLAVESEREAEVLRRTAAEQSVRRSDTRLALLHDIDRAILLASPAEEVARVVAARIRAMLPCVSAAIVRVDEGGERLDLLAVDPPDPAVPPTLSLSVLRDAGAALRDLRDGRPHEIDLARDARGSPVAEALCARGLRHFLVVPAIALGRLVGAMVLRTDGSAALSPLDVEIAHEVSAQVAIALHGAEGERLLAAARREARELFERVPVGLVRVDADGRILAANPALAQMLGFPGPEDMRTRRAADMFADPPERDRLMALDAPGDLRRFQALYRRTDGGVLWGEVEARIARDADGRPRHVDGVVIDVTARKQSEDALRDRTLLAQFAAEIGQVLTEIDELALVLRRCAEIMVERLGAAFARIWTLNEAQNVLELRASAGMYTHLDGPHGRVPVGSLKIGRIASERRPHLTNSVIGDPRVGDQDWARREGMVAFAGYPLSIEQRVVGVMAMFAKRALSQSTLDALASVARSIALAIDNRRAAASLRESLRRAEESDRLKTAFLANVRHETRTPLNVILGFADLLVDELTPEQREQVRPMLGSLQAASGRLLTTIDSVLDTASLEAGTYVRHPVPIDLARAVEAQVQPFEALVRTKGTELHLEVEARARLVADEHAIATALHHVLDNAIKFTSRGGVTVRCTRDAGGAAVVEVRDTGIGMRAEFLAGLFRPFSQADPGVQRRYEGAGMGLAVSKRFLDLEHAEIRVESTIGVGSTVRIRFDPASELAVPGAPVSGRGDRAARPRLLVVEPQGRRQVEVHRALDGTYEVEAVASPGHARESLRSGGVPVAALMVAIPRDGPEETLALVESLRRTERTRRLPILATVESAVEETRGRCLSSGCDDVLVEPVPEERLVTALAALVSSRSGSGSASGSGSLSH